MDNLHILNIFHHRQVVINFYENEELVDRNGFHFDSIMISTDQIQFLKDDKPIYALSLDEGVHVAPSNRFKNHYVLAKDDPENRIEIYFP